MAIRKRRLVRTSTELNAQPFVVPPPEVVPPVFGPFNKFVRAAPCDLANFTMTPADKLPLFVAGNTQLPEILEYSFRDIVRVYGDDDKPKLLTRRFGKFPDVITRNPYVKMWEAETLLWSAATRIHKQNNLSAHTLGMPIPDGYVYSLAVAATEYEIGLALVRQPIEKLLKLNGSSAVAAIEPGHGGGMRFRGVSHALRRVHALAEQFADTYGTLDYQSIDPLLGDKHDDDPDAEFSA